MRQRNSGAPVEQPERTLVVVGAAHTPGKQGLLAQLRRVGRDMRLIPAHRRLAATLPKLIKAPVRFGIRRFVCLQTALISKNLPGTTLGTAKCLPPRNFSSELWCCHRRPRAVHRAALPLDPLIDRDQNPRPLPHFEGAGSLLVI